MQVVSAAASTGRNVGSRLIARRWWGGSERGLWLVGLLYAVIQLVMVGPRFGLGPDELIYASQVYGGRRLQWTAPRSRGVPALIWPVVHLTTSVPALRWYLIALSGVSLALAYRPWLRVRPGLVAPLAGLLFATLWIADFYGNAAMPNLWVALAAVASGGYFVRSGRETAAGMPLCGVAVAVGLLSMMRPSDSVYLAVPMLLVAVLTPVRRWVRSGAVAGGLALGWAVWAGEAYANWGGVLARLSAARAEDASGVHANLLLYAKTLGGPLEWTPGALHFPAWRIVAAALWWLALAPLATAGLAVARRRRLTGGYWLVTAMGITGAAQYVFLLSVVGVRHLLPTYALLMLPTAEGLCWVAARRTAAGHLAVAAILAGGFVGHEGIQLRLLHTAVHNGRPSRLAVQRLGKQLNALGIRPPCAIGGARDLALVAYWAHCQELLLHSTPTGWRVTRRYLGRRVAGFAIAPRDVGRSRNRLVYLVAPGTHPPQVIRRWRFSALTDDRGYSLYLYTP